MSSRLETIPSTKMYTSLNICQRFTRLVETEDTEEIPAVHEEISYLFTPGEVHHHQPPDKYTTLQNKRFYYRVFDANSIAFYSIAIKYHRQAEDAILTDCSAPNLTKIHRYITEILGIHRYLKMHNLIAPQSEGESNRMLARYKNSFLKFTELPPLALQKLTAGLINRQQDSSVKGYFHLMLDVTWFFITMNGNMKMNSMSNESIDTTELTDLIQQVYFVMYKCYEKCNKYTLICSCMSVFWLRVQLYCDNMNIQFWNVHNAAMKCYDEEFTLYMLKYLADLQRYNAAGKLIGAHCDRVQENVEFFNETWSLLLKTTSDAAEHKIFQILLHVEELLSELWLPHGKLNFYYLTWDYYQKRIEDIKEQRTFQQLLTLIESGSAQSLQNLQKGDIRCNGYVIFLRMLRKHLGRHPHHWNKFKGRIYTKFPPVKFQKLSEQGLRNLGLLFFALSTASTGSVNFDETIGRFLGLLKDLPSNKQNLQSTWLIYIFIIKLHLDKSTPITPIYNILGPLLEESSKVRNNFHLLTLFASNLSSYFRVDDLTLKQSLLISAWLENYIKSCAHDDLISLLNTLAMIIERTVDAGAWYEYQNAFVLHVLTPLKRLGVNQSIIGTVAGLIVANSEALDDVVEHFVSENIPGDVMMSFFMTLRRKSTFTSNERREYLTIKAWCWSWFVGVENASFTDEIVELLKGTRCKGIATGTEVSVFEQFLQTADQGTLLSVLKDSERYFAKNLNLHVYMNMALVFHYCGSSIYVRTTSNCYLSSFVDQFLLPMDVLRGTKPAFTSMVEKTWHLFMFSLWKLNEHEADPYLERLIKELTLRYIPHFSSKPTVLLKLTNNKSLCDFVFVKIAGEFFEQNKSKHIGDEPLFKALNAVNTVLDDLLFENVHKKEHIVIFARRFLTSFYDVYMFKNHKVIVIDIVKKLAALRGRYHEIRQLFAESLKGAMKKHLAFSTNQYFQMCYVLVKIIGDVVQGMLGTIKEEIAILECKRGQGFDNHLRQCYDKLVKLC